MECGEFCVTGRGDGRKNLEKDRNRMLMRQKQTSCSEMELVDGCSLHRRDGGGGMVAVGWWYGNSHWEISSQRIESVAVSDRMLVLPDSSEVWLKAGSRLSYNEDFSDDRCVWLEGEAVFDVRIAC